MSDRNAIFLNHIYQNTQTAAQSMHTLLPKAEGTALVEEIQREIAGYGDYAHNAQELLAAYKAVPQEPGALEKAAMWSGIQMNTLLDSTPPHLAELMIQGSTMGVTELSHNLKEFVGCDQPVADLAQRLMAYEQGNIEHLKEYL